MRSLSDLLRDVFQLAYVTEDIDAATSWFESTLGTTRCHTRYKSSLGGTVEVDGQPADEWLIDVALVNAGRTNLEIIRPVSGAVDIYRDGIRPGALATFHHIGVRVDDFDEAAAVVAASGRSWKQTGIMDGAIRFGYVDMTAELGHHVEVMELGPTAAAYFDRLEAESNR
jgi:Glyoxalase/Bleomycin resistance protein/Dioxygenase superfamily